ncbi:flavin reductase family protein [Streptomyces sp. NPDC050704]|uniref:flavin reductase family protein n=1 Tax=Streptomyces sp. NPDC050704 TaxID=3157219 RepID=UPI00343DF1E1
MSALELSSPSPVDSETFREAMAHLAAPLTIVTTRDAAGHRRGFTASAVTSVSMSPPLVLVGLANHSSCREALSESPEFVVNVLAEHHTGLADRFARRDVDRFAEGDFETWADSGLPYLPDATAVFRCTVVDRIPAGDHQLLIGELTGLRTHGQARPLLWYRRDFRAAAPALSPRTADLSRRIR